MKFYVYELVDPRDGRTFYVGKGCGNRERLTLCGGNPDKMATIASIKAAGLDVIVLRIASGLDDREACKIERQCINHHGVANLTNIFPGSRERYAALIDRCAGYLERMIPFSDDWPPGRKLLWILVRSRFLVTILELRSGQRYGSAR